MTPPALVLVTKQHLMHRHCLSSLNSMLCGIRPDLTVRIADDESLHLSRTVTGLIDEGATEVICVPLQAAASEHDKNLASMVAAISRATPEAPVSLADPLGATSECFSALDRHLQQALSACGARELDALILWHDADSAYDIAALERRARRWAAHHKLPYRLASLHHDAAIEEAIAAHRAAGHRHIGIATLAIDTDADVLARVARIPGVVGVSRPLGGDPAVAKAVLAQYAVAALRALETELPLAG
ncbi:MAG: sirohydrochlorin chelatase [Propionibacteriaceae bacterium]